MNKQTIIITITAGVAIILGAGAGYWFAKRQPTAEAIQAGAAAKEPLYYRSPMNPEVTSPVPAKDPMGMDYVPVYAANEQVSGPPGTVQIDPVTVQNIGVRTVKAERRPMSRAIRTVGRVDYDERRLTLLHPKTEGWVEELRANTTGQSVRKGGVLLSIYSPQLVSTQQEYVLALKNLETLQSSPFDDVRRGAEDLLATSLERLRFLDVPEHQIQELTETQAVKKLLHIHSPADGIVVKVGVREGQFVTPSSELFAIADLSRIWVYVDIYEDELPWIQVGNAAEMSVTAVPGRTFEGKLTYIYPYAERQTRTVKVRMEFDNSDLLLKPDMFANINIQSSLQADAVVVPTEAIIRSGLREQVFIVRAPGKFEPREVTTGVSSEGWTQIRDGIKAGDEIVVSAQFLIDSESKLREAAAKMREAADD